MRKRRRARVVVLVSALLALVLGVGLGAATISGNDFRLVETGVTIHVPTGEVSGVVARPSRGDPRGVVLVVHGDGPIDATYEGLYRPWWEAAADAGFATVSWSKPGIDGSTGNWEHQSMADRADEVAAVLDWVRTRPDLPRGPVGLWGSSQAGWVVTRVVAERDDLAFVVAVSPAIDWLCQGRFDLLAGLVDDDASADEIVRAVRVSDETRGLLDEKVDYDTYRARTSDPDPMSPDRWMFASLNYLSDATEDLERAARRGLPTLLLLGDRDRHVDVDETERTYRAVLGDVLEVRRFDASHALARPSVEDRVAWGVAVGTIRPRELLAPGVLDAYRGFLSER